MERKKEKAILYYNDNTKWFDLGFRYTAIYIRVSTDLQAEEGFSIIGQTDSLIKHCSIKGWDYHIVYTDDGYTGANINRPQLQQLIRDIEKGIIERVVVYKLDRLSRSQLDTMYLVENVFLANNVDFVSLNESLDTSTPFGKAMIGVLSVFSQMERENIKLRTQMGSLERVKQGFWHGGGVPFGYDYDIEQGILIPNLEESHVVKRIFQMYIDGHSCGEIAKLLKIKYTVYVYNIINRITYAGFQEYSGEIYPARHKAIISKETFEKAQKIKNKRSLANKADKNSFNLLSGLLWCSKCGGRLTYHSSKGCQKTISCYNRIKTDIYNGQCDGLIYRAEDVEKAVLNDFFCKCRSSFELSENSSPCTEQYNASELHEQIIQLILLYSSTKDPTILEAISKLKEKEREIAESQKVNEADFYKSLPTDIDSLWDISSDTERKELIQKHISKIIIDENKIDITYCYL